MEVLKRVINRKGKCNLVDKITVNNTEITNKQEISDKMNEYLLELVVIWLKVFLRELMIFKSPREHSGPLWKLRNVGIFWQEIPSAILPFSCNFNHNSPGDKYFEAKRVHTV